MSCLKVGDRIRIRTYKSHPEFGGTAGTIKKINDHYVWTYNNTNPKWSRGEYSGQDLCFAISSAEIELISPQSPQPTNQNQTNTKEEEMKKYAVIYHDLAGASQGTIQSHHTTEAEAKEAAELLVAQQRANIQVKAFFAVTIVNTATGKLVASVVDAPPAVNWQNE